MALMQVETQTQKPQKMYDDTYDKFKGEMEYTDQLEKDRDDALLVRNKAEQELEAMQKKIEDAVTQHADRMWKAVEEHEARLKKNEEETQARLGAIDGEMTTEKKRVELELKEKLMFLEERKKLMGILL